MTEFAKRLRSLLDTKKVSAAELSRRTGISEATISRYLSGKYEAKQKQDYVKLANYIENIGKQKRPPEGKE